MDDLIPWLLAQIEADEHRIKRATLDATGPWRYDRERFRLVELDGGGDIRDTLASRAGEQPLFDYVGEYMETFQPERLQADCEAKRRIIKLYENAIAAQRQGSVSTRNRTQDEAAVDVLGAAVQELAVPYADKPGYRAEWRP